MPTGYTAKIHDGKEVTAKEFILDCSRAFGALIMMRDAPTDAEIPERFEPSTYAKENLERAQQQLEYYKSLKDSDVIEQMESEYQKRLEEHTRMIQRETELKRRYQNLLDEVKTWNPPSSEHTELKDFCMKQLQDSIKNDCGSSKYMQKPERKAIENWRSEKIAYALREITYYEESWNDEVERTNSRNEWLKQLRDSLDGVDL